MKRLVLVLAALVTACGAATPTAEIGSRAAEQAATAVALSRQPAVATPGPPPPGAIPTPSSATPRPTAGSIASVSVEGSVAIVREDAIVVLEKGVVRELFKAAPGGSVKDPTWSPDGQQLAFAYAPPRPRPTPGRSIAEQLLVSDIMVVEASGSNPRVAVAHDATGAILETPAWSPDGKAIYFSYYAPTYQGEQLVAEKIEVRRAELGSSGMTTVVPNASGPAASPDGKWLAFIHEDAAAGQSLRVMPLGGGSPRVLVQPETFATMLAPRFSPDSSTLAFSAASIPQAERTGAEGALAWLGDLVGARSALAHGLPWDLWLVPVTGGRPRQLTNLNEDMPTAAWSENGSRLLVYGAGGLYLVDAQGGETQVLSSEGSHGGMDWRRA